MNHDMIRRLSALNLPQPIAVIGMGASGKSAVQALRAAAYQVEALDEAEISTADLECQRVNLDEVQALHHYASIILSPSIDARRPALQAAAQHGALLLGDVGLWARLIHAPVLAVTGSNGKSTVVTLLAEALRSLGKNVELCGNIGRAVFCTLLENEHEPEVYVVELSSYQLEKAENLQASVAALLNISEDHLNRYDSFLAYAETKARLIRQSRRMVLNGDDPLVMAFAGRAHAPDVFYAHAQGKHYVDEDKLVIDGKSVLSIKELSLKGRHNAVNVLTALLVLKNFGITPDVVAPALCAFAGLPHRCRFVDSVQGVEFYDDSKATNIASTLTAVEGLAPQALWLIAGGDGKAQNFDVLAQALPRDRLRKVLLIGRDAEIIAAALARQHLPYEHCETLDRAVSSALRQAHAGETVLLAPACASFDQFKSYGERGDTFCALVKRCNV